MFYPIGLSFSNTVTFRTCLFGVGGPQIGDVTCGGSPTYHANLIKLKREIIPHGARCIISSPAKRVYRSWLPRGSQGKRDRLFAITISSLVACPPWRHCIVGFQGTNRLGYAILKYLSYKILKFKKEFSNISENA